MTRPRTVSRSALRAVVLLVASVLVAGIAVAAVPLHSSAAGQAGGGGAASDRGGDARPMVFMWTGAGPLMEHEPRMFENVLLFCRRHGIVPYASSVGDSAGVDRFLTSAREAGLSNAWIEVGPRRNEIDGATARQFVEEPARRAATLRRFRVLARVFRRHYPDSARITIFDEAPLGTFASAPGRWKADYTREVELFRRWGPAAFAHVRRAIEEEFPAARVGVFLHHPHNASPRTAGRWSLIDEFVRKADSLGAKPEFIYSDVYRGYFNRGYGYEATNAYVGDVARHTAGVGRRYGVPAYQLGQVHTIKLGYTPSRWEIDGNVEAMLDGEVDGIGWYWPNYAATGHVDPGIPAGRPGSERAGKGGQRDSAAGASGGRPPGHHVSFRPFDPNAWGELGPAGSLYGTSRDRFTYSYLRALEATGRIQGEERFDLWIYGHDFDHVEHSLYLRTNPDRGETWELVGHFNPERDRAGYRPEARDSLIRSLDGRRGAVVFHGLSRERFFGGDLRERHLTVKITTREDADGSGLRAVYAVPHRSTRNYLTEEAVTELIEERPRSTRINSLAHHVRPVAAPLVPDEPFVEKVEAPVRGMKPGVLEVEWLDLLWEGARDGVPAAGDTTRDGGGGPDGKDG